MAKGCKGELRNGARQMAQARGQAICSIGEVTAEKFVGPFAAECDSCFCFAKFGEEPDGKRTGVGARFVGVVSEFLDGALEILFGERSSS